ncbi:hypothetical protein RN001_002970 [Aquatica leii]|uniref:Uncharacterized protein n=1 Tax=Aquatica leii TaxID=1421715 RepID=A0AAN7Q5U0_9COLE|nr:hypothetical protein RN001_002970 [Aquatica leii]
MKRFVSALFLIYYLALVYGKPGLIIAGDDFGSNEENIGKNAHFELMGVPDIHGYGGLQYPKLNIQDLGTVYQGAIPPKIVKISSTVALRIPKPYPVKIPHKVPYPVHIDKPYPVPVTHLIKVPHAVPVEVIKNVPVPVEVPKPYPVPQSEYSQSHGSGGLDSYGGSNVHNNYNNQHQSLTSGGFEDSSGYGQGYNGYNSQDSYSQGHEDGLSSAASSNNNYEVKQNQDENS